MEMFNPEQKKKKNNKKKIEGKTSFLERQFRYSGTCFGNFLRAFKP